MIFPAGTIVIRAPIMLGWGESCIGAQQYSGRVEHPERRYDPEERFSLDEDPEDVLRTILGADADETDEAETEDSDPE